MRTENTRTPHFFNILLIGGLLLATLTACETNNSTGDQAESEEEAQSELSNSFAADAVYNSKFFFYAWLADCVNDTALVSQSGAQSGLETLAKSRIQSALADPIIQSGLEVSGQLVWGPAVLVEQDLDGNYSSANLMYCVKETDEGGAGDYYVVGIAGTNEISSYDWFTEDLKVNPPAVPGPAGGHISQGSAIGFENLKSLVDPATGLTLDQYLVKASSLPAYSEVVVVGHSLGGALTQVYASHLQHLFGTSHFAYGYTYAAPTAGDEAFAESINSKLGTRYLAHENNLDVIPKAWQKSTLEKLCAIYDSRTICDLNFEGNPLINGVIQYMKDISAETNYTQPDNVEYFTTQTKIDSVICSNLGAVGGLLFDEAQKEMKGILHYCGASSRDLTMWTTPLATYFAEMGVQHTTAYLDHFIPDHTVRRQVEIHVPGAKNPENNSAEVIAILKEFLTKISAYYAGKTNPNSSCACTSTAM